LKIESEGVKKKKKKGTFRGIRVEKTARNSRSSSANSYFIVYVYV
jgi:hypothetical protein